MPPPRSNYAGKLAQFPDFVFRDDAAFAHRGAWRERFRARVGPAFDGRVVFEIGCFDGALLHSVARKNPTTGFVGLDWKFKAVHDAAIRVSDARSNNVALLRGRGQDVARVFAPGEVDEVWVFHPDPCDRDVELNNRLISEQFLCDVHNVLRGPGGSGGRAGVLALKTDHPGYYQWVLSLLGLPDPGWFAPARERLAAGLPATGPRVRAKDLVPQIDLPKSSVAARDRFDVVMNSPDFWNDPAALAHTAARAFAGEVTLFEGRFVARNQPIYYVELRKK